MQLSANVKYGTLYWQKSNRLPICARGYYVIVIACRAANVLGT